MFRPLRVLCLLGASSLGFGCTGTIGSTDAPGESTTDPAHPKPPVVDPPPHQPGPGSLGDAKSVPGTAPVRRLTRLEYDNTIRDLLGITTSVSQQAKFAADTESSLSGFVRGGAITEGDDARTMMTAGDTVAGTVISRLSSLLPCSPLPTAAGDQDACVAKFIPQFGKRAYRRPLTAHETELMQTLYKTQRSPEVGASFEQAVGTLVGAIIQSPQFLYHWELGNNAPLKDGSLIRFNSYELASKLSYLFWSTMPDDKLFEAADNHGLDTPDQIAAQAQRLLGDERAKQGLTNFHLQWSEIGDLLQIPKDESYKDYSPAVAQSMLDETRNFVTSLFQGKSPATLEALLTSSTTVADASLAKIYGASASASGTDAQPLTLDPKQRAGIFTHLAFLTAKADTDESHPVKRGDAILRRLLCTEFKVPTDVPPVADAMPGGATTRERFSMHDQMPCATCHVLIDPIGFAFEEFDAIGAYRTMDQGHPVDSSDTVTLGTSTLKFANAVELMGQLAKLSDVQSCMATQWMRYAMGRREVASEAPSLQVASDVFKQSSYDFKALLVALTRTRSFTHRSVSTGEVTQ
jgi:hypothetical protein